MLDANSALDRELGRKPWEMNPLDATEEREPDGTAFVASCPSALEWRRA
jgi:hypothetical protein